MMSNRIKGWLALPEVELVTPLALASPFVISGVVKSFDFQMAINEVAQLGLRPERLLAVAVIVTQIGGSVLFLTRRFCWLGSGILAVFTILATLLAHRFWVFTGLDLIHEIITFFEHIAIFGGFIIGAVLINDQKEVR
jgi:transmembrane protein